MDWRHAGEILAAGTSVYDALLNLCVCAKYKGGMGSLYMCNMNSSLSSGMAKPPIRTTFSLGSLAAIARTSGNTRE
jgi:hypothetical protein